MALINECPNQQKEGAFAGLRCEEYMKIKVGTEKMFLKDVNAAEPGVME
jgi:hypothetical protein